MDHRLAVVVAHYHPEGKLPSDLFNLLKHFATLCSRIVFVSTGIKPDQADRLTPFAKVIVRENIGYDFWSYKLGIEALGERSGLDRLVLFNSSFVTLSPHQLCSAFLKPVSGPALRGLTASAEQSRHAQSYFVAFEDAKLICSEGFDRWWQQMTPISDRQTVIERYELGMSDYFAKLGLPIQGAFELSPSDRLLALCRAIDSGFLRIQIPATPSPSMRFQLDLTVADRLNPTHFLWDKLWQSFGIAKLELLRTNPFRLNLVPLQTEIRSNPQLHALIDDALS